MTLSDAAAGLRRASDILRAASPVADPGPAAFGADGPGRLGDLGGDLHRLWAGALDTRDREAAELARRLDDLAANVVRAGAGYVEVDDSARRGQPEVS